MKPHLVVAALISLVGACSSPADVGPDADTDTDAGLPDAMADAAVDAGELRGVWITRFGYDSQADLEAIIDRAAAANFNAVFVQIRGEGDAFYRSSLEPWSRVLTGTFGRDPGWDPLQVAIDRAHGHGMELHAYFNVFSAWTTAFAIPVAEGPRQHALRTNPSWLAVNTSGVNADTESRWFAPGSPAVRAHITAVATDLLANYAVDGLHLDRIRTPGPDYSRDAVTTAAYNAAKAADATLTWPVFMRAQVSAMVADLYDAIATTRPPVRLSAAVWGIYAPLPGCSTSEGLADFHQDSLGWLDAGIIDALVPMIYWSIEPGACTDWVALTAGFTAGRAGRHIWAGMHALDDATFDPAQIAARITHSRTAAQGTVVYASAYLDADPARWASYVGTPVAPGPFAEPAPTPAMAWK